MKKNTDTVSTTKNDYQKSLSPELRDMAWGTAITTIGYKKFVPELNTLENSETDKDARNTLNEYRLVYITSGDVYFESASQSRTTVGKGSIIMLFPNEWYKFTLSGTNDLHIFWVGFKGITVDNMTRSSFFTTKNCIYNVGVESWFVDIFQEIYKIADREQTGHQQYLASLIHLLLGRIYYSNLNNVQDSYIIRIINSAKAIMKEDCLQENYPVKEIADRLGISYSQFRREFKHHCGISPGQYRQELKLIKAKEYLCNTNMSIADIAIKLKFECLGQFSTFFRKRVGVPPHEYRKQKFMNNLS